jgi:putative NADH-flavin reductase
MAEILCFWLIPIFRKGSDSRATLNLPDAETFYAGDEKGYFDYATLNPPNQKESFEAGKLLEEHMKILVIGATRGIGFELMKQAAHQNHEVTVLARKPEELKSKIQKEDFHEKINLIKGDILDREAVGKAVENQDAVCSVIGIGITFKPVTVFSEGAKTLISAMQETAVKRLIIVTGVGAGDSKNHGGFLYDKIFNPIFVRTIYEDKNRQEQLVTASGLDWTIVRPAVLTDASRTGKYRALTDLSGVTAGKIARADVADFILDELKTNRFLRQTPLLTY